MGRRGQECRCCGGCDQCDQQPTRLIANIEYPSGSGTTLLAGSRQLQNIVFDSQTGQFVQEVVTVEWGDVSTSCIVDPQNVGVARVRVVSPGENYTSAPTLEATGGGGSGANWQVTVESGIVEVEIIDPGSGYTSPPAVTFPFATQRATGVAVVRGPIVSVTLQTPGEGYEEPPDVVFSGGTGAEAVATINGLGQVTSIELLDGGQDYPHDLTVTLAGGTTNATATATINGSVVRVDIENPGRYFASRASFPPFSTEFNPTVLIAGPATATARYSGKVQSIAFGGGSGYTSPPAVTLSGGGGEGATAEAELTWQQSHARSAEFSDCRAFVGFNPFPFNVVSTPPVPPQLAVAAPEYFAWTVTAFTDGVRRNIATETSLLSTQSLTVVPWFFPNEAVFVNVRRSWGIFGTFIAPEQNTGVSDSINELRVRRFFSRIAPFSRLIIDEPSQPESATNVWVSANWRQYVDAKNDSFWYLESLTTLDGGDNLRIPSGTQAVTIKPSNSSFRLENRSATFSYSTPQAGAASVAGFSTPPQVSISFALVAGGQYRVAAASVANGGQTTLPDGTVVDVEFGLNRGHVVTPARLTGTVSDGELSAVTVAAGGTILGPATLTSINTSLGNDQFFSDLTRVATGESSFVTSRVHTEPSVSVESVPSDPQGVEALLEAVLTNEVDDNGDEFWTVSSVTVLSQGSGYVASPVVVFDADQPGIVSIPPVVSVVRSRTQPSLDNLFLSGAAIANFTFSITQDTTPQGDPFWRVSDVQLTNAGENNTVGQTFSVLSSGPVFREITATIRIEAVDGNGAVTDFSFEGGRYYVVGTGIGRVAILDGGKFFKREIVETATELASVACLGSVSQQTGWELNRVPFTSVAAFRPLVGAQFEVIGGEFNATLTRVRRCPVPEISVELE